MITERKSKLVQAAAGAIVLTLLMQPLVLLGYSCYIGALIVAVVAYLALGARPAIVPALLLGFACGRCGVLLSLH